ncbi:MAG: sigma-70 family RNA polymerase sigma factor [Planctomycetes bacterium]|nr:sigma-70 family RNA polymerase sigma factor [Planctomycetota bacterium]
MQTDPMRWSTEELLSEAEWLGTLARRLVSDPSEADDLAQDTWIAALRRPPERERPLRPWLARVARNFARMRGRKVAPRASFDDAESAGLGPDELSARLEAQRALLDALRELREPYRSTVLLAYFEHRSSEEIAERQGVSASTVRWRLKTAVDELRSVLDRGHDGRRGAWTVALAPLLRTDSAAAATVAVGAWQGALWFMPMLKLASAAAIVVAALYFAFDALAPDPARIAVGSNEPLPVAFAPMAERGVEPAPDPATRAPASTAPPAEIDTQAGAVASATIEARFVDETGRAIAGVELASARGPDHERARAESGADGRTSLVFELRADTSELVLRAAAPGWASRSARITARRGETAYLGTLTLVRGGDVAGRVVDALGAPVVGARVGLVRPDVPEAELEHASVDDDTSCSVNDSEGAFTLRGAPVGSVRLVAVHPDFVTTVSRPIEVRVLQVSRGVELVLAPTADEHRIAGVVLDPDGTPAPFASVAYSFSSLRGNGSGAVVSDAKGKFRVLVNRGAEYSLTASDFQGRHGAVRVDGVEAGTLDVVLKLARKRELAVRVRTRDGRAIERFRAVAMEPEPGRSGGSSSEGPHPEGIARFVPQVARFELEVLADGYALGRAGPFDTVPSEPVLVELDALPGVRGRVVYDGVPVGDARIEAYRRGTGRYARNGLAVRFDPQTRARTTTNADGAFTLTLRDEGDMVLLVVADGFATAEVALDAFVSERGRDGLAVELLRGGVIEGRVRAPAGRDVAGTIVAFSRGDGRGFTQRVGPNGAYRLEGLAPGRWHVMEHVTEIDADRVLSMSFLEGPAREFPWSCTVADGLTTRFDLELGPGPECELAVHVLVDGAPAAGWSVAAGSGTRIATLLESKGAKLDGEGRARIAPRELGPGFVVVTAIGGELDGLRWVRRMEYAVGGHALELDLRSARVRVEHATIDAPLAVVTLFQNGDFAVRPVPKAGDPELAVLAGRSKLWRFDPAVLDDDPRTWTALDTADVRAGVLTTLRRP